MTRLERISDIMGETVNYVESEIELNIKSTVIDGGNATRKLASDMSIANEDIKIQLDLMDESREECERFIYNDVENFLNLQI